MLKKEYPEYVARGYRVRELGKYVEAHQGRRFGKPTFKGTREEVKYALFMLADGKTVDEVANVYQMPREAIIEAVYLAADAMTDFLRLPHPVDDEHLIESNSEASAVGLAIENEQTPS